jgi:uncharacterized membrane protein YcgQ (UPF0703/DUF1980 family)
MSDFIVSFGLPLAYIALFLAAVVTILFPLYFMLKDLKKAKTALIGVVSLLVVFLISYLLADGEATKDHTAVQMKLINSGLYTVYLIGLGTVIAVIYSSVASLFK